MLPTSGSERSSKRLSARCAKATFPRSRATRNTVPAGIHTPTAPTAHTTCSAPRPRGSKRGRRQKPTRAWQRSRACKTAFERRPKTMTEIVTKLSDTDARNLVETATGETLFVEAGAGTGKTTALVSRIVSLVREGVPITSIAAITFTEKAASELSERVRRRLEEAAEADASASGETFRQAIRDLDQAAIQTLHSFAMRILSLYPLEAGLPPQLRLRDSV